MIPVAACFPQGTFISPTLQVPLFSNFNHTFKSLLQRKMSPHSAQFWGTAIPSPAAPDTPHSEQKVKQVRAKTKVMKGPGVVLLAWFTSPPQVRREGRETGDHLQPGGLWAHTGAVPGGKKQALHSLPTALVCPQLSSVIVGKPQAVN